MESLLCADEEGAQLWEDAFNNLLEAKQPDTARSQLMQLVRIARIAGVENQDDRGFVALQAFLNRVPDAFFLSSQQETMRENRERWHAQIEEHMTTCAETTSVLRRRVDGLLGFFMYREITWRDLPVIINWLTRCFFEASPHRPASDYFFGHIPDENLSRLRTAATPDTWLHQINTLVLAFLDPSFDVNSCSYPPLLLVVDENELYGPLVLETLLWIRPEIRDRRHHHLMYNMTAMEYVLIYTDVRFAAILHRHFSPSLHRFFACNGSAEVLWTWEQLRLREIPEHFFKRHALQECGRRVIYTSRLRAERQWRVLQNPATTGSSCTQFDG